MNKPAHIKLILIAIALFLPAFSVSASEVNKKQNSIMAGISLGWISPTYNEPMNTTLKEVVDLGGFYRINPAIAADLGYNVFRDFYLIAGFQGAEDFIDDSILLNSYFYYFGIRNYPFHNGLVFEVKGGPCFLYYDSSLEESETSDTGFGYALTFAYDFGKTSPGLSFEAGLNLNYLTDMRFEGSDHISVRQTMYYGKILWK